LILVSAIVDNSLIKIAALWQIVAVTIENRKKNGYKKTGAKAPVF